jgi:putative acetyltransferase
VIRLATEADWEAIPEIHRVAFGDHGDDVALLVEELRESEWYEPSLSFVAEEDGTVVGHVMNTWNWLEGGSPRALQLSPLGVLPEHQSRGHGSALVRASLDAVRARGEPLLVLEGNPKYYGRFGFVRADELGLLPPPECLVDWAFQVAVLDPAVPVPQGRVVYSPPFVVNAQQAARRRGRSEAPGGETENV